MMFTRSGVLDKPSVSVTTSRNWRLAPSTEIGAVKVGFSAVASDRVTGNPAVWVQAKVMS